MRNVETSRFRSAWIKPPEALLLKRRSRHPSLQRADLRLYKEFFPESRRDFDLLTRPTRRLLFRKLVLCHIGTALGLCIPVGVFVMTIERLKGELWGAILFILLFVVFGTAGFLALHLGAHYWCTEADHEELISGLFRRS